MNEFLEAVAQTMRNLGVEATVYCDWLSCGGVEFQVQRTRGYGFRFLNRTYRKGNVIQAAIDLVGELSKYRQLAEQRREQQRRKKAAEVLTEKLNCGMEVTYDGKVFRLVYESEDIVNIERCAARLAAELAAEWDALLNTKLETIVRFTSEGGFSLN